MKMYGGIDVGSTTVKLVILDKDGKALFTKYERHYADIRKATINILEEAQAKLQDQAIAFAITGSGGMGLAEQLQLPFIQEVIACTKTIEERIPETEVAIELGGEDAKITFFGSSLEQRMNGSCAGGTGAFIDQMAALLKTDANGLNDLAKNYQQLYPIASRCGVFAKTDVQPLINEGAAKADIAASIFQAVVNQTIAGLAAGRKIKGKVAFLGGPLYFMSELRQRFIETLDLSSEDVIFPENPQLFVALGAAYHAKASEEEILSQLIQKLKSQNKESLDSSRSLAPLFQTEQELNEFHLRHEKATVKERPLATHHGVAFLGIDAGSTTTKVTLINESGDLLFSFYGNNEGQPLETTISVLKNMYQQMPTGCFIGKAVVTGYGEALIKSALKIDIGEVETMAHYKAANFFNQVLILF